MSNSGHTAPEGALFLTTLTADATHGDGVPEPLQCGLPFPRGLIGRPEELALRSAAGDHVPVQADVTLRWPDGSVKWAALHWLAAPRSLSYQLLKTNAGQADATADDTERSSDESASADRMTTPAVVASWGPRGTVTSATLEFNHRENRAAAALTVSLVDEHGIEHQPVLNSVDRELSGPVLSRVRLHGTIALRDRRFETELVLSAFHGTATLQVELRLRNPHKAHHPGGKWILGDAGSMPFKRLSCSLQTTASAARSECWLYPEPGVPACRGSVAQCYQDSSGGDNWQSPNHMARDGRVHRRLRGYELGDGEHDAGTRLRASPVGAFTAEGIWLTGAMDQFWQQFPKRLKVSESGLQFDLFTDCGSEVHELQGGEQKAHTLVVAVCDAPDPHSSPMPWAVRRTLVSAPPHWYAGSGAIPYLTSADEDTSAGYQTLLDECLVGNNSFAAKRELIDEFGWRNFGDLYADHENRHYPGDGPVISHYNNQYDAVAAFAAQFMRSGDRRWYDLFVELARHVLDIDIYHTDDDRAVYNRGMFWHTDHYQTADRSTHRTYPDLPGVHGGGPSAEHLYAYGLAQYYLMTGDRAARRAAIGLGDYVIACDDGRLNFLKWLDRGPTGAASWSGSMDYHGPGRGGGNALDALLTALEVSGEHRFLSKAEELIRRCINPADDFETNELRNVEYRWFYMVFLRSVLKYLDWKTAHGEYDQAYEYARASLLHYVRFAVDFEYVYLERPELLEFPTEAWTGQEFRKAEVFHLSTRYAPPELQATLREKGRYFFERAVADLQACPERGNTRVQVLLTQFGWRRQWLEANPDSIVDDTAVAGSFAPPKTFTRQKIRAKRRLVQLTAIAALLGAAGLGWLVT